MRQLASVTWSSSNPAVAQISNDASNPGMAWPSPREQLWPAVVNSLQHELGLVDCVLYRAYADGEARKSRLHSLHRYGRVPVKAQTMRIKIPRLCSRRK